MPRQTIAALLDHGIINATVEEGVVQAERVMADLKRLEIDFGLVTAQLENEGIQVRSTLLRCFVEELCDEARKVPSAR